MDYCALRGSGASCLRSDVWLIDYLKYSTFLSACAKLETSLLSLKRDNNVALTNLWEICGDYSGMMLQSVLTEYCSDSNDDVSCMSHWWYSEYCVAKTAPIALML